MVAGSVDGTGEVDGGASGNRGAGGRGGRWADAASSQRCFIPMLLAHGSKRGPYLLVLDGHLTHLSVPFINFCLQKDIYLAFFPTHTSHILSSSSTGHTLSLSTQKREGPLSPGATYRNLLLLVEFTRMMESWL